MVDIAHGRAHAADCRRPRRAVRPDRDDAGSVRPVRRAKSRRTNKNTDVFPAVNFVQGVGANSNIRLSYSTTVNRPEFRELAEFEFTDVIGNRAVKGNADLERALIQNVDGRWEMFGGGRSVVAASVFYKHFDKPIERVVIAAANPIATFQNSDHAQQLRHRARSRPPVRRAFLLQRQLHVRRFEDHAAAGTARRPDLVRASAGRPVEEPVQRHGASSRSSGFSTRLLFNYFGDRISDVGANEAPDIIEQGRGSLDLVFAQRITRSGHPADAREPDRQRLPVHADADDGRRRSGCTSWAGRSRCRSATTCSETRHDEYKEHTRNHAVLTRSHSGARRGGCAGHCARSRRCPSDQAPPVNVPGIDKPVIVVTGEITGNGDLGQHELLRAARRGLRRAGRHAEHQRGHASHRRVGQRRHADRRARRPAQRHRHAQPRRSSSRATSRSAARPRRLGRPDHQRPRAGSISAAARPLAKATPASTAAPTTTTTAACFATCASSSPASSSARTTS